MKKLASQVFRVLIVAGFANLLLSGVASAQYPSGTTAADFDQYDPLDFISDNDTAKLFNSFSRANCNNNESISFTFIQESRAVFSHHRRNGVFKHYVTESPPAAGTCHPHSPGGQLNGQHCLHLFQTKSRHAGVHGGIAPSEPSSDQNYFSSWTVYGVHAINWGSGLGGITVRSWASSCNLEYWQFLGL